MRAGLALGGRRASRVTQTPRQEVTPPGDGGAGHPRPPEVGGSPQRRPGGTGTEITMWPRNSPSPKRVRFDAEAVREGSHLEDQKGPIRELSPHPRRRREGERKGDWNKGKGKGKGKKGKGNKGKGGKKGGKPYRRFENSGRGGRSPSPQK